MSVIPEFLREVKNIRDPGFTNLFLILLLTLVIEIRKLYPHS